MVTLSNSLPDIKTSIVILAASIVLLITYSINLAIETSCGTKKSGWSIAFLIIAIFLVLLSIMAIIYRVVGKDASASKAEPPTTININTPGLFSPPGLTPGALGPGYRY
ncbi:MAG: hypothetical protein Sylvanvirus30_2 [Sylvanvirus sp.]|uniref:Transmembrane protein n=1 Tax=Sylvanvirus sp. TaxID=2487774 RepID=A0A3G5AJ04_9VIRU|nr:MAG: hypothetical protein Sylvanvirus30_2 [Sylvanvirus sp.]